MSTPAELMDNLSLDDVDISIAENYLKQYKSFGSVPDVDLDLKEVIEYDSYRNKIIVLNGWQRRPEVIKKTWINDITHFRNLAKLIEKNADLFAQLEYVIRKLNIYDVKKYDIKILLDRLNEIEDNQFIPNTKGELQQTVYMDYKFPLSWLVVAVDYLAQGCPVVLLPDTQIAVVVRLFTQLCHEAGFDKGIIMCIFYKEMNYPKYQGLTGDGTIAIVTEKTNMDCAGRALLDAPTVAQYRWRLTRVMVQESVYTKFKKALERNKGVLKQEYEDVPESYKYGEKLFLIDYLGTNRTHGHVYIESYRTTKELMSLLCNYSHTYLSVWCNDTSISNEIAIASQAKTVWINDYGEVDDTDLYVNLDINFEKKVTEWRNLTFEKRKDIIAKIINECISKYSKNPDLYEQLAAAKIALKEIKPASFVRITNNKICLGLSKPVTMFVPRIDYNLSNIVEHLVNGNSFLIDTFLIDTCTIDEFLEHDIIPVTNCAFDLALNYPRMTPKVGFKKIWCPFGETFAN